MQTTKAIVVFAAIITIFHTSSSFAQTPNKKLDSLLTAEKSAKEDTNKVLLLSEIAQATSQADLQKSRTYAEQALGLAEKLKYDYGKLKAYNLIGRTYALQSNYPQALTNYHAALNIAQQQDNPMRVAIMSMSIGNIYTLMKDYEKAYTYLTKAKNAYDKAGAPYATSLVINFGVYYAKQNKHAESIEWYKKGIDAEEKKGVASPDLAILYSNVGSEYILLKNIPQALYYCYKALDINYAIGNDKSVAYNLTGIGAAYAKAYYLTGLPDSLKDKNILLAKAENTLTRSLELSEKLGMGETKMESYEWLANIYEIKKDYFNTYKYYYKYTKLKDSLTGISTQKAIAQAEAEFRVQKTTDSLKYSSALKDKEIKQHKLQRNSALVVILMAGLLGVLFVNRQKLKHKNKLIAVEAEKEKIEQLARHQLADFTKSIQEKNNLIEQFAAEIEKYQSLPCSNELQGREAYLDTLKNSVILTDEQWAEFQSLFEKVDPGYIGRVRTKFPDITAAEMRFVLLTKLGLNNKEMAAMLGVTNDAVRVSKYRLLKKIHLPDDTSPEDFFKSI